jgi:hypothetical protein
MDERRQRAEDRGQEYWNAGIEYREDEMKYVRIGAERIFS